MAHAPASNKPMTPVEWAILLTLSVLWGGSFFFNGIAVKELPTFTIVVCRVTLAALILQLVLRLGGAASKSSLNHWGAFLVMGLLNNVIPFSLIVWGQSHLASGLAAILNATTPLFTVIVAHFCTADEKLTPGRILGVVIGLVGVAIMMGGDALQSLGLSVTAQIACLAGALSYAFAGVFGRRFRSMGISPMETAAGQVTASSFILLPVMSFLERPWTLPMPGAATIVALVGMAALSTALA
jgi:drug/metabolite transporter (DMT)-like permease